MLGGPLLRVSARASAQGLLCCCSSRSCLAIHAAASPAIHSKFTPSSGCLSRSRRSRKIGAVVPGKGQGLFQETGEAKTSGDAQEIVIAVGPAFGSRLDSTLLGLPHREVLQALMEGVQEEGMKARVVKIYSTSDCGFIGHAGAQLSGSGISIGIQSKGTTVIHRRGLEPLNNLELFPQAPNLTLKSYRVIGRNAAKYAKGEPVLPVPIQIDNMARLKFIVKTTILHLRETEQVIKEKRPQQVSFPC